ncbi:MAG: hypothetical protein AN487_22980, partial [Anabaena sp. CRKS33]
MRAGRPAGLHRAGHFAQLHLALVRAADRLGDPALPLLDADLCARHVDAACRVLLAHTLPPDRRDRAAEHGLRADAVGRRGRLNHGHAQLLRNRPGDQSVQRPDVALAAMGDDFPAFLHAGHHP